METIVRKMKKGERTYMGLTRFGVEVVYGYIDRRNYEYRNYIEIDVADAYMLGEMIKRRGCRVVDSTGTRIAFETRMYRDKIVRDIYKMHAYGHTHRTELFFRNGKKVYRILNKGARQHKGTRIAYNFVGVLQGAIEGKYIMRGGVQVEQK